MCRGPYRSVTVKQCHCYNLWRFFNPSFEALFCILKQVIAEQRVEILPLNGAPERKVKRADGSTMFGAGSVYVLYRTATGFSANGFQLIAQGVSGLPGTPEIGDDFGTALAAGRFNGGSQASLVIGSPFDSEIAFHAGGIHVLAGSTNGLGIGTGQRITQNTANVEDSCEGSDAFGLSLGSR